VLQKTAYILRSESSSVSRVVNARYQLQINQILWRQNVVNLHRNNTLSQTLQLSNSQFFLSLIITFVEIHN